MKRFDCLSPKSSLFGPHLLEASAGTGKTFAIEHVCVRLILENIPIEEILAVTFTKASTRELRLRIYASIEKAYKIVTQETVASEIEYLIPHVGSFTSKLLLSSALKNFDRCQIFTIHGFCYRMLKEFAFEADQSFSMEDPDLPLQDSQKFNLSVHHFFDHGIDPEILVPEQLKLLLGKCETVRGLGSCLSYQSPNDDLQTFGQLFKAFSDFLHKFPFKKPSLEELKAEFDAISVNYKAVKGNFDLQIEALYLALLDPCHPQYFKSLILHSGSIFIFLDPSNKKIRLKQVSHCIDENIFPWFVDHLGPIVQIAQDRKHVMHLLNLAWHRWKDLQSDFKSSFSPDEILQEMQSSLEKIVFLTSVKKRYKAAIIDEFQDTDPLQFEIFNKIFIQESSLRALYLVGDPKQSIYRFRKADVYTYLRAKDILGEENLYCLDTNFRSSKALLDCLNELFSKKFLHLPKNQSTICYQPVKVGSSIDSFFPDTKGALHWILGDEKANFENAFLPYAVAEIERLQPQQFKGIAILVKDRFESKLAQDLLTRRNIPYAAKSHESLASSYWYKSFREFINAVIYPDEENFRVIYEKGPFFQPVSLGSLHEILLTRGLRVFFAKCFSSLQVHFEMKLIMEELLSWEDSNGFSCSGLIRFLNEWEKLEGDLCVKKKSAPQEDAVQILTLHISKGLEFEIVFALALASASPRNADEDEEILAEKQRQLYVAMTRAKKRLYVPFIEKETASPIQLFSKSIFSETGPFIPYIKGLQNKFSNTFEEIQSPYELSSDLCFSKVKNEPLTSLKAPSYELSVIESFSSLSKRSYGDILIDLAEDDLPAGKETGLIIHEILEGIFSSKATLWRDLDKIEAFVMARVANTSFALYSSKITSLIQSALALPLESEEKTFCLSSLNPNRIAVEFEFLYQKNLQWITGFIDLVFTVENTVYIVDWKTNILKDSSLESMQEVMLCHDYSLQAEIYAEAVQRYFGEDFVFGGAFYLFLRHGCSIFLPPQNLRFSNE